MKEDQLIFYDWRVERFDGSKVRVAEVAEMKNSTKFVQQTNSVFQRLLNGTKHVWPRKRYWSAKMT